MTYESPAKQQNLANLNEAFVTSWQMVCNDFPEIVYFAQNVTVPSISISFVPVPFRNQLAKYPDNKIEFGSLTVTFIVDEDFNNYDKLFKEFLKIETAEDGQGSNIRSVLHDITVTRLSSNNVPIARFIFTDCSLADIGSINYTTTGSEPDVAVCDVSFNVTRMEIENLRKANKLDGML